MIHPTAIIHPRAKLDSTVRVGPYAVIDEHVEVGAHCQVGPHVYLTGHLTLGAHNQFHAGCVIGDAPQDLKYQGEPTRLRIGDHNVFREHATVHRSNQVAEDTVLGSHNLLMVNCHVGHNCHIGSHVIIANGALVAGHAQVADKAFISGNCLVHQFVRIGTLAMMQGGSAVSKDLPPYTIAARGNGMCGLNLVGLKRAGIAPADRLELKQLYRLLFLSGNRMSQTLNEAQNEFTSPAAKHFMEFVASAKRGVCTHVGRQAELAEENGE